MIKVFGLTFCYKFSTLMFINSNQCNKLSIDKLVVMLNVKSQFINIIFTKIIYLCGSLCVSIKNCYSSFVHRKKIRVMYVIMKIMIIVRI